MTAALYTLPTLRALREFVVDPGCGFDGYALGKRADLSTSTAYSLLKRWAENGWLVSHSTTSQAGGPRYIYRMTDQGREVALDLLRPLQVTGLSTGC